MFWQFGSRSETAAADDVGAAAVPVGAGEFAADVGFVVGVFPLHAATARALASASVRRPCPMPPGERFIDASS